VADDEEQRKAEEAAAQAAKEAEEAKAAADAEEAAKAAAAAKEDESFDKDRALATIKEQRKSEAAALKRAKDAEAKLQEIADRDKTEAEKAADKATAAEGRATAAERTALQLDVALDKAPEGMSIAQVRKLAKRLTGKTREEFEADAEELFADFTPAKDDDEEKDDGDKARRPKERLKPGAVPAAEAEETDPKKLAEKVPRRW
jgi:hypothetical protein